MPGALEFDEQGDSGSVTVHLPAPLLRLEGIRPYDGASIPMARDPATQTWKFNLAGSMQFIGQGRDGKSRKSPPSEALQFLGVHEGLALVAHQSSRCKFSCAAFTVSNEFRSGGSHGFAFS